MLSRMDNQLSRPGDGDRSPAAASTQMKRSSARFTIVSLLAFVALCAVFFAVAAARPSRTIRMTAHANGSFTFETQPCSVVDLEPLISDAVSMRRRWFLEPRTLIQVESEVEFARVPEVMHVVASAGCEEIQLALPPELSSKLSMPRRTSDPWQD